MPNADGTPTELEKYNSTIGFWDNNNYTLPQIGNLVASRQARPPTFGVQGNAPWSPLLPGQGPVNQNLPPLLNPTTGLPYGQAKTPSVAMPDTTSLKTDFANPTPFSNLKLVPSQSDVTNALDLSNLVNANTTAYYNRVNPGSSANEAQLSRNIASAAAGQLAPQDMARIMQQGAEMGASMGSPGSPSAISGALVRYMGGIQALRDKASQLASEQFARTPKPTDIGQFLAKPEHTIQLAIEQSRREGTVLHDNQETQLRLALETMAQQGRTLDRETQITLKNMDLGGQIKHDETSRLIAALGEGGQNYRANLGANTQSNIAAANRDEQRYKAQLQAETARQTANLKYGQRGYAMNPLPQSPGYGGYNGGLPNFQDVFGGYSTPFGSESGVDENGLPVSVPSDYTG